MCLNYGRRSKGCSSSPVGFYPFSHPCRLSSAGVADNADLCVHPVHRPPSSPSRPAALPWTSSSAPGSMRPALGRTQYCLGAVVLTLKAIGVSERLRIRRVSLIGSVKGPRDTWHQEENQVRGCLARLNRGGQKRSSSSHYCGWVTLTAEGQLAGRLELDGHVGCVFWGGVDEGGWLAGVADGEKRRG